MTTLEKLFVHIFERRNRIKQQVKQQTELYLQNLVSKLIIDGIDPPPWLWNPNQSSSDVQKVLNKEELISEIFLPRPQHPVGFYGCHYYPYNQSVTQETAEILDGSFKATYACSNSDTGAKQSHAAAFEENNAGCEMNTVPEMEVSVTSPEDETDLRISNICAAQEQSIVRIQRSKSRQKALELRTSAKAKSKNPRQESTTPVSSAQDRSSFFGKMEFDLVNGMEDVGEPFVICHESCDVEELNKGDSWKKENEIDFPAGYNRLSRNSEVLHVQSLNPTHQENNESNSFQTSGTENYMGVLSKEGHKCIPQLRIEEYQRTVEGNEKSTSGPHALEVGCLDIDYYAGKDDLSMIRSVGDDKDLDPSKTSNIQLLEKLQSAKRYSWPSTKRRKIEKHETSSFSPSPSFRIQREQRGAIDLNINVGGEIKTVLGQSPLVNDCNDEQIHLKMSCQLTKSMESSDELIMNERLHSIVLSEHENISSLPNLNQGEESVLLTSVTEIGGVPHGCLSDKLDLADRSFDVRKNWKNDLEDETLVNTEGLIDAEGNILNRYYLVLDSQLSGNLAQSPAKWDLEMIGADQTMPVLEGFIMDSETLNENVNTPRNEITFDKLELPQTSVDRASILEEVCKSGSMQTPQISSVFKLQGIHTCHMSVPNVLLECADMKRFSALNGHVYNRIRSSIDETKNSFQGMSYSACVPCSKGQYGCDLRNPFTSPVGELWDKIALHRDSSGNRLSSNPEFACFPIEEDPDSSEENDDISFLDCVNENVDTVVYTCTEREPLADISAAYSSGTSSLVAGRCAGRSSLNHVATEVSFKQAHSKLKAKVGKHSKNRSEERENDIDILLTGAKGTNNSDDSLNMYSKISSSYATSSTTKQRKLLGKEAKQNNNVSNVTSFIALVQQKQDDGLCKGKRDIKVKAVKAAEAAKRQQEKRDQERKLRKEAVKLDRARVERENLRLMELNKKKKEEERKKKDAIIVAKKRAREEAERIERERKIKRMEEASKQRLDEGKFLSYKVDKEKQPHISVTPAAAKTAEINNLKQKITETSYEISPYQCSDEEDDDEDVLPNKKVIPSWARKNCVALVLPLLHEIDPEVIFPPDSFFRPGEEVVIPGW